MPGQLDGKRVGLFVADLVEDIEAQYPRHRLREEGAEVTVVGPEAGTFQGKRGSPVRADTALGAVSDADFDALVLPGGFAPDRLRREQRLLDMVRAADGAGKPVAAICHAGWILASAGVLRGRRVTGYWSIRDDLVNAGAEFVDDEVVTDGALITSRYPEDLGAFCRTLIGALA